MSDNLTPQDRRKAMQAVKSKGTKPERQLFSMLAGMGLKGWRKHANDITGKPDVVFEKEKLAIFVDGCFWHGCPHCKRPLKPQTNRTYWERKISRNIERDQKYNQQLAEQRWTVMRIWEHEIRDAHNRSKIRPQLRQNLRRNTP
jgi:DNA mismatch endonuclease (patch repair protein)